MRCLTHHPFGIWAVLALVVIVAVGASSVAVLSTLMALSVGYVVGWQTRSEAQKGRL